MKTKNKNDWKSLIQEFVGNMLERIGDNVSKRIHIFLEQLKRKTAGVVLILIGVIFILVSLAILINTFLGREFLWVGWGAIGMIVMLIGYKMSKD